MKKLILIAGVIIAGLALSGCAKNPIGVYHSYAYYRKHKNQAEATYGACKKISPAEWHSLEFKISKGAAFKTENCFNAANSLGNKKYPNLNRGE